VDCDLKSYFDTIPHDRLMALVKQRIVDGSVLAVIEQCLKAGVMEELKGWQPTERGTPQGAVISPMLANLYLNPLDHEMGQRGWGMVRYADDFVVLCRTKEEAETVLNYLQEWTTIAGLTLHPTKTRIVDASQAGGFDFLGYHFERGMKWPREKSLAKFKEAIRQKTKRTRSGSMKQIVEESNRTLRGWMNYFKHSIGNIFPDLDKWVRGRLRTILRKRHKGKGRARGKDHQRWPNAYFAELGLISLALIRAKAANAHKETH
jgi:RNA-directed DNA polymerase